MGRLTRRGRPAGSVRTARTARTALAVVTATASAALLAACVADPPPAQVVGSDDADGRAVAVSTAGLTLAVDRLEDGFNPHLRADQGSDTDLVSALTLPSAFRQVGDDAVALDTDLLVSAAPVTPTGGAPFTVRYTLRDTAQWSDGAPVDAEDFDYLWRQMRTQPGVVDPAGYEHVTDVRSSAGGKVVDVAFDTEYPRWRTLFAHLVPAHLLKDSLEGFQGALRRGAAVSAGPYMVHTADLGRGIVEFVRNDRYWAAPAPLDQIVVRRVSGVGGLGQQLRSSPYAAAIVGDDPVSRASVTSVPGVESVVARSDTQLEVGFSTTGPAASDLAVRRAAAAAVRPDVVGVVAGGDAGGTPASFPFPAGVPPVRSGAPAEVAARMAEGGYTLTDGRWTGRQARTGESRPVELTLGVAAGDPAVLAAAQTVADQWRGAGFAARVWELDAPLLYGDALPHGLVDAVLSRERVDTDPVDAAISRYSCPVPAAGPPPVGDLTRSATTASSAVVPPVFEQPVGPSRSTPSSGPAPATGSPGTPTPTVPSRPPETAGRPGRASDVTGSCDPALTRALGEAGRAADPAGALREAGARVAELALRVPLVRENRLVARGPGVDASFGVGRGGADGPAPISGLLDSAAHWRRTQ